MKNIRTVIERSMWKYKYSPSVSLTTNIVDNISSDIYNKTFRINVPEYIDEYYLLKFTIRNMLVCNR